MMLGMFKTSLTDCNLSEWTQYPIATIVGRVTFRGAECGLLAKAVERIFDNMRLF